MRRWRVYGCAFAQTEPAPCRVKVRDEQLVGCLCLATVRVGGGVVLNQRVRQSPRMSTRTELRVASAARPRANPSLHPTCYRLLRRLPQAGELQR
jgi:hypothetical protein